MVLFREVQQPAIILLWLGPAALLLHLSRLGWCSAAVETPAAHLVGSGWLAHTSCALPQAAL